MTRPPLLLTRRTAVLLTWILTVLIGVVVPTGPAHADTSDDKLSVLSRWTQPGLDSYTTWNAARLDPHRWPAYGFDWTTDYCSGSPDHPLGFDFRRPCQRHDFGYRNYHAVNGLRTHKSRLDQAFHADLKRTCVRYPAVVRPACYSLAWTYYRAVHAFGTLSPVNDADLRRSERAGAGP